MIIIKTEKEGGYAGGTYPPVVLVGLLPTLFENVYYNQISHCTSLPNDNGLDSDGLGWQVSDDQIVLINETDVTTWTKINPNNIEIVGQ
jgi:hypothetical protein